MTSSTLGLRLVAGLLALVVVTTLPAADEKPADKELNKLVDQLGDDDPAQRDAARKQLFDKGESALPLLTAAIKSHPDPDVKLRAIVLSQDIKRGAFGQLKAFAGHTGHIRCLVLNKDGTRLLSGSMDGTARLWDVESAKELKRFEIKSAWCWQVAFSPDEKSILVSGGSDGALHHFDIESGKEMQSYRFPKDHRVYGAAFSPDGKHVFGGVAGKEVDYSIRRFETDSGKEVGKWLGHAGFVWRLILSPDGKKLASIGCNDSSYRIWDVATGKELVIGKDAHDGYIVGSAFSPDGKTLLTSGRDSLVKLWDVENGRLITSYKGLNGDAESVVWSADGKRFLVSDGKTVHVFERDSGKVVHRFEDHAEKVYSVVLLPDGRRAISGGEDLVIRMWGVPR